MLQLILMKKRLFIALLMVIIVFIVIIVLVFGGKSSSSLPRSEQKQIKENTQKVLNEGPDFKDLISKELLSELNPSTYTGSLYKVETKIIKIDYTYSSSDKAMCEVMTETKTTNPKTGFSTKSTGNYRVSLVKEESVWKVDKTTVISNKLDSTKK